MCLVLFVVVLGFVVGVWWCLGCCGMFGVVLGIYGGLFLCCVGCCSMVWVVVLLSFEPQAVIMATVARVMILSLMYFIDVCLIFKDSKFKDLIFKDLKIQDLAVGHLP